MRDAIRRTLDRTICEVGCRPPRRGVRDCPGLRPGHQRHADGEGDGRAGPGAARVCRSRRRTRTRASSGPRNPTQRASTRIPGLPVGRYEVKSNLTGFSAQTRQGRVRQRLRHHQRRVQDDGGGADRRGHRRRRSAAGRRQGLRRRRAGHRAPRSRTCPSTGGSSRTWPRWCPGVSLGFHTDPTKSTQFAPQVAGGGGRNINYLIDGGDNNDDTVGGLVQNFPLDSIGEFNFETQRFRADTGRANGGTIKVVTKSGTNEFRGSVFDLFRDKALNGKTETEKRNGVDKGEYKQAPVRRQPGRPDHQGQDPLLRVLRAHPAGHAAVGEHLGALPGQGRRLRPALPGEHGRGEGDRTSSAPTTTFPSATASTTTTRSTGPAR